MTTQELMSVGPRPSRAVELSGDKKYEIIGRVGGRSSIPRVDVFEVVDREAGKTDVKVHQVVKNLKGDILSDTELWHVYTIANGLIERMDIKEGEGNSEAPSAAFSESSHAK